MEGTIGVITPWAANFAPRNWLYCQGQILSITEYAPLYAIIGNTYGGDGTLNFALPNLASRIAVGTGQGPGLTGYVLGQTGGTENNTITTPQMAQHTHVLKAEAQVPVNVNGANSPSPQGSFPGSSSSSIYNSQATAGTFGTQFNAGVTVGTAGGNIPVNNIQPVLCLNYIICVEGIFPSRP